MEEEKKSYYPLLHLKITSQDCSSLLVWGVVIYGNQELEI